ncbi:MAG TPA: AMP-binding protein [Magnetospirillaceae bacterium]
MTWRSLSRLLIEPRADDVAVALRPDGVVPFARFRADVAAAVAQLEGCRNAAVLCQDSYAFAVGFFAAFHAGADVVLPPNGLPATLDRLSGSFDRLIDDAFVGRLNGRAAELHAIDAERAQIVFFTSGSTGNPKRVARSLGMLEREVATFDGMWRETLGDGPVFATVTHQHLYGLSFKVLWSLAAGRAIDTVTREIWENLLGVMPPRAVLISSPAHLSRLAGFDPLPSAAQHAAIFTAGAPLTAAAAADVRRILGTEPIEIFGSTETGAVATRRQINGDEPWSLLPGVLLRTDDEQRVSISSPYVHDWVATGDRVESVGDGFRFIGRADRVAKIEGRRISLADVEAALVALPWVETAAVVVLPGERTRVAAAAVLTAEGRARLDQMGPFRFSRLLRRELSAVQESAGLPKSWRFVAALPERAMGKRNDSDVAALFAAGAP